jgi:hypothetical protein
VSVGKDVDLLETWTWQLAGLIGCTTGII